MPETLKQTIGTDIEENTDSTADYMAKINQSFFLMLKNPTDKEIEKHRKIRDALISLWLASLFKDFEEQLYNSAQKGIDEADKQLKTKNITEVKDKNITADTFEKQVENRQLATVEEITLTSQSIKTNSERVIRTLSETPNLKDYKKVASELAKDLKNRGITYFNDRAGRAWDINRYIDMKTLTETMRAWRLGFFTRCIQYGEDLVRVVHAGISPCCELCAPFENKILSVTGHSPNYLSIASAEAYGLHHPNCDHYEEAFEIAPEDKGNEGNIILNEANQKRYDYNVKNVGRELIPDKDLLTVNPKINNKVVEGRYTNNGIDKLREIDKIFSDNGYNLSSHALRRIFERTATEQALKTISEGNKYIDRYKNITYYLNGLSIHLDKETNNIITAVYRNPKRPVPKTWKEL